MSDYLLLTDTTEVDCIWGGIELCEVDETGLVRGWATISYW